MFNSKHKRRKTNESREPRISRRQAIKNCFIAYAGVERERGTQIVIQVLLTPGRCGLLLSKIKNKNKKYFIFALVNVADTLFFYIL